MKLPFCLFYLLPVALLGQPAAERGRQLFEKHNFTEAIPVLKSVDEDDASYASAQYYLGRIAFEQKEYDDAAEYFEEATEAKNGQVADYFNWLGNTYGTIAQEANVIRQGMLAPKMKSAWEKAIALDARNIGARQSLISFYTQAPALMGGSMDKAKEMARQIGAIDPVQGHRSMGNLLTKEKNLPAAEKEYLEMTRLEPRLAPVLGNFYLNEKMFDKAFRLFEDDLRKNPDDMLAIYQLGKASAISGQRLDEGEQWLLKYLDYTPKQNEPSHAGANMRLAQVYEKKGRKAEARQKYEAALKLDSHLQEAKEGLSRVSK